MCFIIIIFFYLTGIPFFDDGFYAFSAHVRALLCCVVLCCFVFVVFIWQAKTTVDSFLPVSLVVHNASAWPIDVVVEVTSAAEGKEDEGPRCWGADDEDDDSGPVMWSGMPRYES